MYQVAIVYNLSSADMRADGLTDSEMSQIYQSEIPKALALCGFTEHLQRSFYATDAGEALAEGVRRLREVMPVHAPNFCRYATRVHLFRFDDWIDVTNHFTGVATFGDPRFVVEPSELEPPEQESQVTNPRPGTG